MNDDFIRLTKNLFFRFRFNTPQPDINYTLHPVRFALSTFGSLKLKVVSRPIQFRTSFSFCGRSTNRNSLISVPAQFLTQQIAKKDIKTATSFVFLRLH